MTVNSLARYSLKARRWMVQLAASGLWNALLFPWFKALPCPALNCYGCPFAIFACPIGTLQNFVVIRQVPLYTLGLLGVIGSLYTNSSDTTLQFDEVGYNLAAIAHYRGWSVDAEWGIESYDFADFDDHYDREGWRVALGWYVIPGKLELRYCHPTITN